MLLNIVQSARNAIESQDRHDKSHQGSSLRGKFSLFKIGLHLENLSIVDDSLGNSLALADIFKCRWAGLFSDGFLDSF